MWLVYRVSCHDVGSVDVRRKNKNINNLFVNVLLRHLFTEHKGSVAKCSVTQTDTIVVTATTKATRMFTIHLMEEPVHSKQSQHTYDYFNVTLQWTHTPKEHIHLMNTYTQTNIHHRTPVTPQYWLHHTLQIVFLMDRLKERSGGCIRCFFQPSTCNVLWLGCPVIPTRRGKTPREELFVPSPAC